MEFHCDNLLLNILIFVAGLWFLIKGSDIFVDSAAAIARIWKVSELVIGLTLVSIGTSLPEFASSLYAACYGETDFIIGNVVGSNVTNITLILGVGILGAGTLAFSPQLFSRDAMLMLGVFVVTDLMVFATDVQGKDGVPVHGINIWSGILLLLMGIGYCFYLFRSTAENSAEDSEPEVKQPSLLKSFLWLAAGLVMIIGGSKALVDTVVWGAEQLSVDTMIISATLVAFGTSVPELAVTLAGVFKKTARYCDREYHRQLHLQHLPDPRRLRAGDSAGNQQRFGDHQRRDDACIGDLSDHFHVYGEECALPLAGCGVPSALLRVPDL